MYGCVHVCMCAAGRQEVQGAKAVLLTPAPANCPRPPARRHGAGASQAGGPVRWPRTCTRPLRPSVPRPRPASPLSVRVHPWTHRHWACTRSQTPPAPGPPGGREARTLGARFASSGFSASSWSSSSIMASRHRMSYVLRTTPQRTHMHRNRTCTRPCAPPTSARAGSQAAAR